MIDVRIMAHPSRKENVYRMLSTLSIPDSVVSWDDRDGGGDAMYTARKAWTASMPEGCTHRLVLQDDIDVCDNFLEIAEMVAAKHPDKIISFFHCEKYSDQIRYIRARRLWGCAIMMPASKVFDCWHFIDGLPENPRFKNQTEMLRHDTTCIALWALGNAVPIINTVPSLVQHLDEDSLVGFTEKRVAYDYVQSPSLSGW